MNLTRRALLGGGLAAGAGFLGLKLASRAAGVQGYVQETERYGALVPDTAGILDLPSGFSYRVLSRTGDEMEGGLRVPGDPDGMAAFAAADGRVVLVRNHELGLDEIQFGAFGRHYELLNSIDRARFYDLGVGDRPHLGGTTTLVYDVASGRVERQFMSLAGTLRNCAGGPTPWGSWLSCEETEARAGEEGCAKDHGYVFEVKADAKGKLVQARPLKAMGRFYHEAAAVDPKTGIVYMTEDRDNGLIYRFVPNVRGQLATGGRLQALALRDGSTADTRNWPSSGAANIEVGASCDVRWIDLEDVEASSASLRDQGRAKGAAIFARGEGAWFGNDAVYLSMTNGGAAGAGQVWRYRPSRFEATKSEDANSAAIELFIEPNDKKRLDMNDNITVAPWGDLIICEDSPGDNYLRGVTGQGKLYALARNAMTSVGGTTSEFCGACFSPDGTILFVNIQRPGLTLAITGPWDARQT